MLETEAEILQASWLDMLPFEDRLLPHFPEHDADDKSRKGREGRASEDTSEHFGEGPLRYEFGAVMLNGPSASVCIIR